MKKKTEEKNFISWQAPEFEYQAKDVSWYWLSVIVTIFLIALAVWQKNLLFAIFVIIAELVVLGFAGRFPTVWEFKIDEKGITINRLNKEEDKSRGRGGDSEEAPVKFYSYDDLLSFDIHPAGKEYKELVVKLKPRLKPLLKINIYSKDEEKIKNFLLKFLPQEEIGVSVIDAMSKLIRF